MAKYSQLQHTEVEHINDNKLICYVQVLIGLPDCHGMKIGRGIFLEQNLV